jgi:hypothetical protein
MLSRLLKWHQLLHYTETPLKQLLDIAYKYTFANCWHCAKVPDSLANTVESCVSVYVSLAVRALTVDVLLCAAAVVRAALTLRETLKT